MSMHGHQQATDTGLEITASYQWNAVSLLITIPFFTATRRWKVAGIAGRVLVAGAGGACTFVVNKAPSGTTLGNGTALNTGSFNVVGSADGVQTLTLAAAANLEIAIGDSIGIVLTGTPTAAVGTVTVTLVPN